VPGTQLVLLVDELPDPAENLRVVHDVPRLHPCRVPTIPRVP
jgi:hypothetical protein